MPDSRWMGPAAVAAYVDMRVDQIARLVKRGKLPRPSYHFGPRQPRWDREALDALFQGKEARPSMDAAVQEIAVALARKPSTGDRGVRGVEFTKGDASGVRLRPSNP